MTTTNDSHIDVLLNTTSLCMCEVEKKISDFLGLSIKFEEDGNLYIYSNDKNLGITPPTDFNSFLDYAKNLQSDKQ